MIGYILEMQEAGTEEWKKAHEKTLRGTEYVVTGLSAAMKYHFRVAGVNINGTGEFSEPCAATEPVERIGKIISIAISCKMDLCRKDMSYMFFKKTYSLKDGGEHSNPGQPLYFSQQNIIFRIFPSRKAIQQSLTLINIFKNVQFVLAV